MSHTGKCPHCNQVLQKVRFEHLPIHQHDEKKWIGASLVCPFCQSILNVSVDPIALRNDIVNQVVDHLKRGK